MHFSSFCALAVASRALAAPAPDGSALEAREKQSPCFKGGTTWGSHGAKAIARDFARIVCQDDLGGRFYERREKRSRKTSLNGQWLPKVVQLTITYEGDRDFALLTSTDCQGNLTWLIDRCDKGGVWNDGRWDFVSDPNVGYV